MSKQMSKEEFTDKKKGGKKVDKTVERPRSSLSARDFIMNRATELVQVPIIGPDGTIDIEIRARLTKAEIKEHKEFLSIFADEGDIDDDTAERVAASFLAAITTDNSLDEEFWNSDSIDPYIAQELIVAFLTKASETIDSVKTFR